MKGSINLGGVKDISESPLRVLSGPPKCELIGETDFFYNFDVKYDPHSNGALAIVLNNLFPASGISDVDPQKPYPHGKWVLDITYTSLIPIQPAPVKFSMAQITDYDHRGATSFLGSQHGGTVRVDGPSEFLVEPNRYETFKFANPFLTDNGFFYFPRYAHWDNSWLLQEYPDVFPSGNDIGSDLYSFITIDFSQTIAKRVVLPEQADYCDSYFIPFVFGAFGLSSYFGLPNWTPLSNGFGQIAPTEVTMANVGGGQTASKVIIGTLQMRFRRVATVPLFTFTLSPPRTVNCSNRTFFNRSRNALITTPDPAWDWDFGDGSRSTDKNPAHSYAASGKYIVTLNVTDASGQVTAFNQAVVLPLVANFSYSSRPSFNPGPVTILSPTDQSLGAVTWDWDWGDGSPHDANEFPAAHEYPRGQLFAITLKITDGAGHSATISKNIST